MSLILPGEIIELKDGDVKVTEDFRKLPEQPLWGISSRAGVVQARVRNEVTKIHLTSVGDSKYFPKKDDRVLGIVSKRQGESYTVNIDADKEAVLGQLEFDGASKRSRPHLEIGDLVYCRVLAINKFLPHKQTCKCPSNQKDWTSGDATYGSLKEGIEIEITGKFVRTLLRDSTIFDALKKYITFEVAIGVNNKIWISTKNQQNLILLKNFFGKASWMNLEEVMNMIASISEKFIKGV